MAVVAFAFASASPLPVALSSSPSAPRAPPAFLRLPLRARRFRAAALGPTAARVVTGGRRRFHAKAVRTQREKEEQETEVAAVEESFPVRETGALEGADTGDGPLSPVEESWAIKLEQSFNIFLTDSIIMILTPGSSCWKPLLGCRISVRVSSYMLAVASFISVLHLYETFGWWRRADYIKVHFAESMNEFHHLLIMEELGGNSVWVDRFLALFSAFFYYFITVAMYMLSPRMAYHFSECVERHAYSTYDKFLKLHGEELKKLPAPEAAINYYMNEDLYLFGRPLCWLGHRLPIISITSTRILCLEKRWRRRRVVRQPASVMESGEVSARSEFPESSAPSQEVRTTRINCSKSFANADARNAETANRFYYLVLNNISPEANLSSISVWEYEATRSSYSHCIEDKGIDKFGT